jgi:hypothetical protein
MYLLGAIPEELVKTGVIFASEVWGLHEDFMKRVVLRRFVGVSSGYEHWAYLARVDERSA